jgi:hypothetical protein
MEKIKLEKSGNFMWVTDLKTNTVTRFPAKDTYYAFEDKNRVLVLTWDKNNGETYHRYKLPQLVDSNEEPFISFAALDTFLAANLGFNGGGGTSGTTPNLTEVLAVGDIDGNVFTINTDEIISLTSDFRLFYSFFDTTYIGTGGIFLDKTENFPVNSTIKFQIGYLAIGGGSVILQPMPFTTDADVFYNGELITDLVLNVGDVCELKCFTVSTITSYWILTITNKSSGSGDYLPLAGGTMDAGADIFFDNGSIISEGTYDFGGFGDIVVSGITNSGDGFINGIMGWGDPAGTLWSDLNGIYKKTSIAVTPYAIGAGDIGMHTPEPDTYNYYLQLPSNPGFNGVAYFLAPGNRSGWGDPNNDATTDPPVNYWRLCVLSDYPSVYFTNPSTDPFSFPTSGWVPVDDTIPVSEGGNGYDYIANYDGGFTADILYILNGNGGISRICSIGYEDNWQAGVRYVFGNSGTIRHATNGFTIVPDSSFDYTKRFAVGSLWTLDNGDTYECLNADLNAAVWKLYSSPATKYKVFTALLTQSGGDSLELLINLPLVIGITYEIMDDDSGTVDFTNVGAPNNNLGTFFVATGTTPNSWGVNLLGQLLYNTGAPVVTVLENTIGNIWFNKGGTGKYSVFSSGLFNEEKLSVFFGALNTIKNTSFVKILSDTDYPDRFTIRTSDVADNAINDSLYNTPIEIRVYN